MLSGVYRIVRVLDRTSRRQEQQPVDPAPDTVNLSSADAAAAAYEAHAAELLRFAARLVSSGDASDVVASAVARTLGARAWTTIDDPRAYLYRAVYNEALSMRRRLVSRSHLVEKLGRRALRDTRP